MRMLGVCEQRFLNVEKGMNKTDMLSTSVCLYNVMTITPKVDLSTFWF